MEESAPIDTEVRREAEVVRQVRESEEALEPTRHSEPSAGTTSPTMHPVVPGLSEVLEDIPEDEMLRDEFGAGAEKDTLSRRAKRLSAGKSLWNALGAGRIPPAPLPRGSSTET